MGVLKNYLGNQWNEAWLATGLPDNSLGIPATQDKRFTALGGLKAYLTAHAAHENAPLGVTAAIATALHTAVSNARTAVNNALSYTAGKYAVLVAARDAFRKRFRGAIDELEQLLGDDDPKWYDFGLNCPADPATPGAPFNVHATALGSGRVLIQIEAPAAPTPSTTTSRRLAPTRSR